MLQHSDAWACKRRMGRQQDGLYSHCPFFLQESLQFDPWARPVLAELNSAIRVQLVCQYCAPYSAISLSKMAAAFACPEEVLTDDVVELISGGSLPFRVDSAAGKLVAKHSNKRSAAYTRAQQVADDFVVAGQGVLVRMSAELHGVSATKAGGDAPGRGIASGLPAMPRRGGVGDDSVAAGRSLREDAEGDVDLEFALDGGGGGAGNA